MLLNWMTKFDNNITCNHNTFINYKVLQDFKTSLIPSKASNKQGCRISLLSAEEVDVLDVVWQQENKMGGDKIKK